MRVFYPVWQVTELAAGYRYTTAISVVYLPNTDKYRGLTRRLSQGQKGLDERTLMASRRPFHPW